MGKIGRNDPCPCGSGMKYKNCCLGKNIENNRILLPYDIGSLWNLRFIKEKFIDYREIVKKYKDKIFNNTKNRLNINIIDDIDKSENFLHAYLNEVEKEMKKTIEKYTLYELFFWTHRIPPLNVFSVEQEMTIRLYREVLVNAIIKYGEMGDNFYFNTSNSALPDYIKDTNPLDDQAEFNEEIKQVLLDSYILEILAMFFVYCTQRIRTVNKGGVLVNNNDFGFDAVVDEKTGYLINLFDERLKYNELLSTSGSYVEFMKSEIKNSDMPVVLFVANVDHRYKVPIFNRKQVIYEIKSNYIPLPFLLRDYFEFVELFDDKFIEEYDFTTQEFRSFLYYLLRYELFRFITDTKIQISLLQRCYLLTTFDRLYNGIIDIATEINLFDQRIKCLKSSYKKIIKFMTYPKEVPRNINLWTRGPRKIFIPINKDYLIMDFTGFFHLFDTLLRPIAKMSGKIGNIKSENFEKKTQDSIKEDFGDDKYWIGSEKLKFKKGNERIIGDIDASFILNQFLFIIECKSINVSFGFLKGDKQALNFRKGKLMESLNQIDSLAKIIANNHNDLNIRLPDRVKYIVPLVVTPFPEYIWELSDNLFLSKDLPRIITIKELKEIKKLNIILIKNKPFIKKLS